jgi:integrase
MKSIEEFSAMQGKNRFARPFKDLHIKQQVSVLLELLGHQHLHREKVVSSLTATARANVIYQFISDLKGAGYPLKNIMNLKQKHIQAISTIWKEQGLAAATLQTRFSILRWLAAAVGKKGLILTATSYGFEPQEVVRSYVAVEDKSWSEKVAIPDDLIQKAYEIDPWIGINLELMQAFGLRISESVLLRPLYSDKQNHLLVEEGTKGGRTRTVPIELESQRSSLERAKTFARLSDRGALIRPGKSKTQMVNRIYYVCRKLGITKDQLGITPHGLRHGFANDMYHRESGVASIVRGGPVLVDRDADTRARTKVTQALGHARLDITAAYTGHRIQGRPRNADIGM